MWIGAALDRSLSARGYWRTPAADGAARKAATCALAADHPLLLSVKPRAHPGV